MATPSNSDHTRSWERVANEAAAEKPPILDVRFAVLRQIQTEIQATSEAPSRDSLLTDLLCLFNLGFSRAVLGGVAVGTLTVAVLGWRAYGVTSELLLCLSATSHLAI
jgi:hypothetical protein